MELFVAWTFKLGHAVILTPYDFQILLRCHRAIFEATQNNPLTIGSFCLDSAHVQHKPTISSFNANHALYSQIKSMMRQMPLTLDRPVSQLRLNQFSFCSRDCDILILLWVSSPELGDFLYMMSQEQRHSPVTQCDAGRACYTQIRHLLNTICKSFSFFRKLSLLGYIRSFFRRHTQHEIYNGQ